MSILAETQRVLDTARARADSILVAYSGGKDSKVVLDLCLRTFKRVECFHMALVPGLDCIEQELDETRRRHKVTIRVYPHWLARKLIFGGAFSPTWFEHDDLPEWKLADVYALAITDSGIDTIATGAKKADSSWRRRFMSTFRPDAVLNPIAGWHKYDVLSYLRSHAIPEPPSSGHSATGIDLSVGSLCWLHDTFPADFEKLCRVFPFAPAVIWRRKFYGE
jgi:3'-phosphoadenosine 5'-phosphosulfate sulfotransferase (PAPS reductase)/FAD synthetase